MSDLDATTPRVFLARHGKGETEWTISGQHTGTSDIPLTALGERQVTSTGSLLVGPGKVIDPRRVRKVWVSPRQRAMRTFQLLFGGIESARRVEGEREIAGVREGIFGEGEGRIVVTEQIREWDYGNYEGMKVQEIIETRKQKGLDQDGVKWSVWRDGCEGGESKADVEKRLDRLIAEIRDLQRPYMQGEGGGDVVLVAHGLILRCFVKRWLKLPVDYPLSMILSPGALATLSYKGHDIDEPCLFLGTALPAPAN